MSRQNIDTTDLIGGAITVGLGIVACIISLGYSMGSTVAIGPGVFPLILGGLLVLLGLGIIAGARGSAEDAEERPAFKKRAILCVVAGLFAFAMLIGSTGLIPAITACVVISRLAEPGARPLSLIALSLGLCAICWAIFVFALSLPLPLIRWPF